MSKCRGSIYRNHVFYARNQLEHKLVADGDVEEPRREGGSTREVRLIGDSWVGKESRGGERRETGVITRQVAPLAPQMWPLAS